MKNRKYYMLYKTPNECCHVFLKNPSTNSVESYMKDITGYDLITLRYQKEAFLAFLKTNIQTAEEIEDIFLARIDNPEKIRIYECLFQPPNLDVVKTMSIFANERWRKVEKNENIVLDKSREYQQFLYRILRNILSNNMFKQFLMRQNSLVTSPYIKQLLNECDTLTKLERNLPRFEDFFAKYKSLRALVLEYIIYYYPDIYPYLIEPSLNRKIDNIFNTSEVTYEDYVLLTRIKANPCQNKALQHYYEVGGLEAVFNYMDTNDIYSSTLEDLLRVGILTDDEYLKQRQRLSLTNKF